jgi:hypothetical protein
MRRTSSATRSYLHQLAEPVPHPTALLTPRRPAEHGASARSALDAIPPILDSISEPHLEAATPHLQIANPAPHKGRRQTSPPPALPVEVSTRHQLTTASDSASHFASNTANTSRRDKRTARTSSGADDALPRPHDATRESPSGPEPLALQNNAAPRSEDRTQSFAHTPSTTARIASNASAQAEPNRIARDESSPGIRVHIGTVEVRTATPVPDPKPAPAIDRRAHTGRSGIAAQPLSRGLAWSHGLVQG